MLINRISQKAAPDKKLARSRDIRRVVESARRTTSAITNATLKANASQSMIETNSQLTWMPPSGEINYVLNSFQNVEAS